MAGYDGVCRTQVVVRQLNPTVRADDQNETSVNDGLVQYELELSHKLSKTEECTPGFREVDAYFHIFQTCLFQ